MTDLQLVSLMKRGDTEAFTKFINKYYAPIFKYCTKHCSCSQDAEDLTQETFLHFFQALSNYEHRGKVLNSLYTIAGNLLKDNLKRVNATLVEETILNQLPDVHQDSYDRILDRIYFNDILSQLPPELRSVIDLFYFKECTLQQMSEQLGIGLPLTKYRLRKAKIRLKEILKNAEQSS